MAAARNFPYGKMAPSTENWAVLKSPTEPVARPIRG